MVTLSIHLPEEKVEKLSALANRLQISIEELATAQVLDLLARPEERFEQAARHVVEKNREL